MADLDVDPLVLLICFYQKVFIFAACVLSLWQFAIRHKVSGLIDPSVPSAFNNQLHPLTASVRAHPDDPFGRRSKQAR